MRTKCPHMSSQMSNRRLRDTFALRKMSRCRSCARRLLSDLCQLFSQFTCRWLTVRLCNRHLQTQTLKKRQENLHQVPREGCYLELQQHLCFAVKRDTTIPFPRVYHYGRCRPCLLLQLGLLAGGFQEDAVQLFLWQTVSMTHLLPFPQLTIRSQWFRREMRRLVGVHVFARRRFRNKQKEPLRTVLM